MRLLATRRKSNGRLSPLSRLSPFRPLGRVSPLRYSASPAFEPLTSTELCPNNFWEKAIRLAEGELADSIPVPDHGIDEIIDKR